MEFRQAIRIGHSIEGIFKLPCIAAIRKDIFGEAFYELYGFLMHDNNGAVAREGDWVCEDYDGKWHLITNEEYESLNTTNYGD